MSDFVMVKWLSSVSKVRKFFDREEGATMVEYGLMVALIAVICIGAVSVLGTSISAAFGSASAKIAPAS